MKGAIKSIPRDETVMTSYADISGNVLFVITRKDSSSLYVAYRIEGDEYERLGRGESPVYLESKFNINECIKEN